jgi:hypothetical protein
VLAFIVALPVLFVLIWSMLAFIDWCGRGAPWEW